MSKEFMQALADITSQIKEQIKFYKEIGVSDIGGSLAAVKQFPTASLSASKEVVAQIEIEPDSVQIQDQVIPEQIRPAVQSSVVENPVVSEKSMPKKGSQVEQAGLFGDMVPLVAEEAPPAKGLFVFPGVAQDASLEAIRADIGDCTRCKLHEHRTNIVFGEGNPNARLVFVGEGPGADEDATGRPFIGRAGQLLDKIIAAIGMKRDECYIANVVKCRPPQNRTPERDEVATCEQFLFRQLSFIRPKVIVALGSPAFQCLMKTKDTITRSRGQWLDWNGIKVMPTFHPAYLLRSPDKKREAWEDMKKVRDYLASLSD
jgi:DNA polymerase